MKNLTLEEALSILRFGWGNREEEELYNIANDIVARRARILHLMYKKEVTETKLAELDKS